MTPQKQQKRKEIQIGVELTREKGRGGRQLTVLDKTDGRREGERLTRDSGMILSVGEPPRILSTCGTGNTFIH